MKQVQTYIMFMELPDGKILFKIGHSNNVKKRLSSHKCSNPFITDESPVFTFDEDIESYLHCCFSKFRYRIRSEWFWIYDISVNDTMRLIEDAYHYFAFESIDGGNKKIIQADIAAEYTNKYLKKNTCVLDSYCDFDEYNYYNKIKLHRENHKTQIKKIKNNLNNYIVNYQNTNR